MFFPLPNVTATTATAAAATTATATATATAAAAATEAPALTHMLGGIWSSGHPSFQVGCPWFVLGKYNPEAGTFTNVTEAQPIDSSTNVIWSTVGQVDDGRLLFVGWFNVGASALTVRACLPCPALLCC